ncbi:GNAT family N-acetyltransferase [Acinetobacter thermotolerans]|uniref:GNAT family N-acetyltransferase n=1 Tax=Acinetobacter thermotolerans TaxID=3151487 RepID=UPI00325B5C77
MNQFLIRPATVEDLERIGEIYNQEIRGGTATWNYTTHTMAEFQNWFQHLQKHQFPLLVVEDQSSGKVIGYANYDQFRSIQGFYPFSRKTSPFRAGI